MTQQTHVAVIDYGMGNLHSVASALEHVSPGAKVSVTADAKEIERADRIIFPGVGAIRDCMAEILRLKVDEEVNDALVSKKPVLAICVGLQALMSRSEECGGVDCLNIFSGDVKGFSSSSDFIAASSFERERGSALKVPHMGWNQVEQTQDHPLWHAIPDRSRFYFVHSFYCESQDRSIVSGQCEYGLRFDAVLAKDNLFAAQFHPEKSHTHGLQLLKNFMQWDGRE